MSMKKGPYPRRTRVAIPMPSGGSCPFDMEAAPHYSLYRLTIGGGSFPNRGVLLIHASTRLPEELSHTPTRNF